LTKPLSDNPFIKHPKRINGWWAMHSFSNIHVTSDMWEGVLEYQKSYTYPYSPSPT
jgi:hypothetical protein